jgi:peptidoglycan/xylan/chitin deacetylase (PgdA/CDA1 family)
MAFAKGILCLTFDNMGSAVEVGQGKRAGPADGEPDISTGFPNVLELLDRLDVKATFFIEGWNALHYPRTLKRIAERGHEIGIHGWVHEVFHSLSAIEAERVLRDAQAAFRLLGIEPRGFRAPGGARGSHALCVLRKLGIQYDASVDDVAQDMTPRLLEGEVPNVPWQWPMIDYYQYHMHPDGPRTPAQLELLWSEKLEQAAAERGLVTFIFHPFVSAVEAERFGVLTRLLTKAKDDSRLEVLTALQIAERLQRREIG